MLFFGWNVLPDSKETKIESSNQEDFPSAAKNAMGTFSVMLSFEVYPYSYFWWCKYSWSPSFQWGSHKGSSKKDVTRKMVIFRPPSQCHQLSLVFSHPLPPCHQANSDNLFWEFKYWERWWRDDAMFALSFMIN